MHHPVLLLLLLAVGDAPQLADEPQFLGRTREQWIAMLESGDRRHRTYSAWAIAEFAVEQTDAQNAMVWLNELLILTESTTGFAVRYWGAVGLGRAASKLDSDHPARVKAVEVLQQLLTDTSLGVRLAAAEWLGRLGRTRRALPVLVSAMSNSEEAVRVQAVAALEQWGPAARPAIETLRAATKDSSEYVKRISTRALQRLEEQAPVPQQSP